MTGGSDGGILTWDVETGAMKSRFEALLGPNPNPNPNCMKSMNRTFQVFPTLNLTLTLTLTLLKGT